MFSKTTQFSINYLFLVKSYVEQLSNGLVLMFDCKYNSKIGLYDPNTTIIKNEIKLDQRYKSLSDPSEDWFLLIPLESNLDILVISKETLNTITTLKYDINNRYALVDKQLAILSFPKNDLNKIKWVMTFYDKNNNFQEVKSFNLKCNLEINDRPDVIRQLANGLIACGFQNTIQLFQKETNGNDVQYREKRSVIINKGENYVELTSGELLTYSCGSYKIWDTNDPKLISFDIKDQPGIYKVFPMIDGVHLVLIPFQFKVALLYNMLTKQYEKITLKDRKVNCLQVLQRGSLFIETGWALGSCYYLAELTKLREYKKTFLSALIQKFLLVEQLHHLSDNFPKELELAIFYDLYLLLAKEQPALVHFVNELPELMAEEKQHNVCSL